MTDDRMTIQEFIDKMEWEGGLAEALFGYGISWRNIKASTPEEGEILKLIHQLEPAQEIYRKLVSLLNEYDEKAWD